MKPRIYLKPGELHFDRRPAVVTTVLGSCISATFFHRVSGFAGICHAMQPRCPDSGHCLGVCPAACRFAVCAIEKMLRRMAAHGVPFKEIEVKLFGGAATVGQSRPQQHNPPDSMGRQNVDSAMETIRHHGLILAKSEVGGTVGRKLIFDTTSGDVFLKRLGAR